MSEIESFFEDYDVANIYAEVQGWLESPNARNFVVEFGRDEAKIARDLDSAKFSRLIEPGELNRLAGRPVRWINVWSPHLQPGVIDVIANTYKISDRFRAILKTSPPSKAADVEPTVAVRGAASTTSGVSKNDIELANGAAEKRVVRHIQNPEDINHYVIADSIINFQSFDLGEDYISVGANWIYNMKNLDQRLWSWLFLCDDSTVISIYEDARSFKPVDTYMKALRGHIRNVLSQLSAINTGNGGSMSLISVRTFLQKSASHHNDGPEGSSNLFYYLFDNWYSAYQMIIFNQARLAILSTEILGVIGQRHQRDPDKRIIPELYSIGKQLRTSQHLYKSYKNLIDRILNYKAGTTSQSGKRVAVALTASERFERLGDRIELLVLSSIDEAIGEKDALMNTYFQITAQKDSAATAKLSRNATLLSKLGVLFLPVSLMTSYFSTQIPDLQNIYTAKTYWECFAVVMIISFIALFFLSRVLVTVTESLDAIVKSSSQWVTRKFEKKTKKSD